MNPFTLLDSILADYASPRVRRLIHTLILLACAGVTIWLGAEGDWREALLALAAALYAGANKANTSASDLTPAEDDAIVDDGESYWQAGGLPYPSDEGRAQGELDLGVHDE